MDVGVVLLVYYPLELVGSESGIDSAGISKGGGGYNTLGDRHTGKHILLVALGDIEGELEGGFEHLRGIVVHHGDGDRTAILIIDDRSVAAHLLPLEGVRLGTYLTPVITEIRGHGNLSILHEEFGRNAGCDGGRHTVAGHFQRVRVHREIIGLKLVELLATTGQHHQGCACSKRETRKAV